MRLYHRTLDAVDREALLASVELLEPEERARVLKYAREDDRLRTLVGRELMLQALRDAEGDDFVPVIKRTEAGKPYAENSALCFSLSHSGGHVVCVSAKEPVGIDIEEIRIHDTRLVSRLCTDREKCFVFEGGDDSPLEVSKRLLRVWTAKEAYFKYLGTGITELKGVDIFTVPVHFEEVKLDGCCCTVCTGKQA